MTDDLAGLLDGSKRPGVYRVQAVESRLPERLIAAGWRVAETGPFDDLDGFYDSVAAVLGFPSYFGRNLDALWDCLTDLDQPTALIIAGWTRFAASAPLDSDGVRAVLSDRAQEDPPFAVVLAD